MNYKTYQPHNDLKSFISCYWTLEVPAQNKAGKQRIVPDGCIEMVFILGDDIKRYTSENDFILQPRAMILGQTIAPFYVEPTGYVNSFAIRFYPQGFVNFTSTPIQNFINTETPLIEIFTKEIASNLEQQIIQAQNTQERINIIESFLLDRLKEESTINRIVQNTVDMLYNSNGNDPIYSILKGNESKRRQLERNFKNQIGMSPKQLGKIIRLQTALKMMLNNTSENMTSISNKGKYYDQAHFIKDFKEFTWINPKDLITEKSLILSNIFYK